MDMIAPNFYFYHIILAVVPNLNYISDLNIRTFEYASLALCEGTLRKCTTCEEQREAYSQYIVSFHH
jgi:hypothetical protein